MVAATASSTIPIHISSLLALFLNSSLKHEWNPHAPSETLLKLDGLDVAHIVYRLPWPLADREMLIHCGDYRDEVAYTYSATCSSRGVPGHLFPVAAGRQRIQVESTWRFTALADGSTHVYFSTGVDDVGNVPEWVTSAGQAIASSQSITSLVGALERFNLPPHPEFEGWKAVAPREAEKAPTEHPPDDSSRLKTVGQKRRRLRLPSLVAWVRHRLKSTRPAQDLVTSPSPALAPVRTSVGPAAAMTTAVAIALVLALGAGRSRQTSRSVRACEWQARVMQRARRRLRRLALLQRLRRLRHPRAWLLLKLKAQAHACSTKPLSLFDDAANEPMRRARSSATLRAGTRPPWTGWSAASACGPMPRVLSHGDLDRLRCYSIAALA